MPPPVGMVVTMRVFVLMPPTMISLMEVMENLIEMKLMLPLDVAGDTADADAVDVDVADVAAVASSSPLSQRQRRRP
jgi:hypothetical protein